VSENRRRSAGFRGLSQWTKFGVSFFISASRELSVPSDRSDALPTDVGVVELELPGDLRRVGIFSTSKVAHPWLGTGDGKNDSVAQPARQGISPARKNDLFSGPRPRRRQRRYADLRRVAVCVRCGGRGQGRCLEDDLKLTALNNDPLVGLGKAYRVARDAAGPMTLIAPRTSFLVPVPRANFSRVMLLS
jgi:hypothetical protein